MKKFICALLATLACLTLFACTPSNVEKAEAKMKDAGYNVAAYKDEEAEGVVGGFVATKGLNVLDSITAVLFKTKDDAKKFAEEMGSKAVQDGKWVYFGAESAIEAFTK
jgi:hypothetical protein